MAVHEEKCECKICILARKVENMYARLDLEGQRVLDELWDRMEMAETDLAVLEEQLKRERGSMD